MTDSTTQNGPESTPKATPLRKVIDQLEGKPDIRALSNHIWNKIKTVDPLDWYEFQQAAMATYNLEEQEFLETFKQPTFFRNGEFMDDFLPVMQREKIQGFFQRYVHHLTNTESPPAFHFMTALTLVGAAARRNIWVNQRIYKVWPCVQTLILGPSGKMGKTTCTSYGMKLGEEAGVVDRIADEITPEALKRELSGRTELMSEAVGLLYASELGLLFAKSDGYNQGLIQALTDLFDSRDSMGKQTKTAGTDKLKNIAVSFLACSNEGWATLAIPSHAIGGGFLGRMLVAYQQDTDKEVPFPEFPDPAERQHLIEMLKMVPVIKGEFGYTPEGKEWYRKKYHWIKQNWSEDERIEPFWSRYGVHLLRLGMLMRVNEMIEEAVKYKKSIITMDRRIDEKHFKQADGVLLWCLQYLPRVYSFLGISGHGETLHRIVRYLYRKGGSSTYSPLARAMAKYMSSRELKEALASLLETGVVTKTQLPPPHVDGRVAYKLERKLEEI